MVYGSDLVEGQDSGLRDDDEADLKLDKDFTTEPVSVIGLIAFSFFVVWERLFSRVGVCFCSSQ